MWKLCPCFQPAGLLHKAQPHCSHNDGHPSFKMNPPVSFPQSLSPPPLQVLFLWKDPGQPHDEDRHQVSQLSRFSVSYFIVRMSDKKD